MATKLKLSPNEAAELIRTFKERSDHLKERGRGFFVNERYMDAIRAYQQGFTLCNNYFDACGNDLPMQCDFAGAEEVKQDDNKMWLQEFEKLKAIFCNNMAACYQKMGDLEQADSYNNWALKECPDYAKALHRKCMILEDKGEYTQAVKVAEWCSLRFGHEDEPEDNQQTVPHFRDLAQRCKERIPYEVNERNEKLKQEADAEFDAVFTQNEEI